MIILVTGGRKYSNTEQLYSVLDWYHEKFGIETVIQGGARGADELAKEWCWENGILPTTVLARWNEYGKSAGFIRNKEMFILFHKSIDIVIAFPGGNGTKHCIKVAKSYGFNPIIIEEELNG